MRLTIIYLLVISLNTIKEAFGWLPSTKLSKHHCFTSHRTRRLSLSSSSASPDLDLSNLKGKVLVQRIRHALSPASEVMSHDALVVEERMRFVLDPDSNDGTLLPHKRRSLHLLDYNTMKEFYRMDVHEQTSTHRGLNQSLWSTIALILYLTSNPKLLKGRVLELECQLGLGALLGSIALAHLAQDDKTQVESDIDLLLPSVNKDKVALPHTVDTLILTDTDERDLNVAFQNVKHSGVVSSKVFLEELDWQHRNRKIQLKSVQTTSDDPALRFVDTIVGADLDYSYPSAKQLARVVAKLLLPDLGTFIHVSPDNRPDLPYLHKLLREGYRMTCNTGYLKMQSHIYQYQVIHENVNEQEALDELDLQKVSEKSTICESLIAHHHPSYDGYNGEFFWPIETGQFESKGQGQYLEKEEGGMSPW